MKGPSALDVQTERRRPRSTYEPLLRWASECGAGSWLAFRDAHDWLVNSGRQETKQVRATTTIHALSMLGHLEIDWEEATWAISPAALTILPNAGAHAILTGMRTHRLLDRLYDAAVDGDYFAEPHRQEWGPDAIFLAASGEDAIEHLAQELGIDYEVCVSERLAKMLPAISSYLGLSTSTPAAKGYGFERFNVRFLKWERAQQDDEPGLYKYDVWGRPVYRFISDDRGLHALDWPLCVHAEIAREGRHEIRYEPESVNGILRVPFAAQLPALQARAAVLCTGLMPELRDGRWCYPNVPRATADAIALSLGQGLVVGDARTEG